MMTESDIPDVASATPTAPTSIEAAERVYPMSREGRRQALILLSGVVTIWIFALWTLITILQDGVGGVEWVSLALMLGLLVVAPVAAWVLLEEANSHYIAGDTGIRYQTLGGIDLHYGWDELAGFVPAGRRGRLARFFLGDDDSGGANNVTTSNGAQDPAPEAAPAAGTDDEDEPETLLLRVQHDHTDNISNPLVRFLHKLEHRATLPIYGGLENRQELRAELSRQL
jgi:hypothetical protein